MLYKGTNQVDGLPDNAVVYDEGDITEITTASLEWKLVGSTTALNQVINLPNMFNELHIQSMREDGNAGYTYHFIRNELLSSAKQYKIGWYDGSYKDTSIIEVSLTTVKPILSNPNIKVWYR